MAVYYYVGRLCFVRRVAFVRNNRDPAEQIASMNERIEMIHAMRLALAESSEAQNNAVMAHSRSRVTKVLRRSSQGKRQVSGT